MNYYSRDKINEYNKLATLEIRQLHCRNNQRSLLTALYMEHYLVGYSWYTFTGRGKLSHLYKFSRCANDDHVIGVQLFLIRYSILYDLRMESRREKEGLYITGAHSWVWYLMIPSN